MKKLAITSAAVFIALIGFIVILWLIPCNGKCCRWKNNCQMEMKDGKCGDNDHCRQIVTETCDSNGNIHKEVRIIVGDDDDGCPMMNGGNSCDKDNGGCSMKGNSCPMPVRPDCQGGGNGNCKMDKDGGCGMQMMNGCCCCCCRMMMMNCNGGSCKGDSASCKKDSVDKHIKIRKKM
ncbi:MAG: hypothetical protein HY064_05260 [Bacteroidetes bacterium]|nr:hypothetical protein [Bacteroidota bacterium]